MSHAFTKNHLHVVFSTKGRLKIIAPEIQARLWSYMTGICRNHKMISVAVGGIEDHTHLLFHLPPVLTLSKAIGLIKANSSKWMNEHERVSPGRRAMRRSASVHRTSMRSREIHSEPETTSRQD
jgi:REP element-mobilizing transposase RayT